MTRKVKALTKEEAHKKLARWNRRAGREYENGSHHEYVWWLEHEGVPALKNIISGLLVEEERETS